MTGRYYNMLCVFRGNFFAETTTKGASTALERLQVALVFDIHAAHDALDTIRWMIQDVSYVFL
jgi:hypothetical protein